jgi:glycosyltransferase involved in cell wall biosynthesis
MRMTDVSVVVPARNVAPVIAKQLSALVEQDYPGSYEVVVVDDASSDETAEVVDSFAAAHPGIFVACRARSAGLNAARNAGAHAASAPLLLFCDADDEVDVHWVTAMAEGLATSDAVGGRVDLDRLNDARLAARRRPFPYESGLMLAPDLLPSPAGCCCGVRREVWVRLGGFDEAHTLRGDDETEFFWRLQRAGFSLGYAPDAVVGYRLRRKLRHLIGQQFRAGRGRSLLVGRYGRVQRQRRVSAARRRHYLRQPQRWSRLVRDAAWVSGRWFGRLEVAIGRVTASHAER